MAWPTAQDYSEAVQNPRLNFQDAELKTGQVELTQLGLPRPRSGNFATVYRMQCGQRHWAIRCFLRNITDQQKRYAAISEYLRLKRLGRIQIPYMVGFEFLENGIKVSGQWYPILKMEWVEGELLDKFIEKHLSNSTKLRHLADRWVTMIQALESIKIAHGDLQHGNILIVKDELKLIDYDGMFVPTLSGFSSNEVGHYNYQHPSRTGNDFRADIDRFSAWVIYIALISLSIEPNLWQQVGAGDEFILLRKEDFVNPDTSATLALLTQHNDALIQSLVKKFKQLLRNPTQIPSLDSGSNQKTTTHTISTSSDWLADYLPQKKKQSKSYVQSPPILVKPASYTVKSQTRGQSQSSSSIQPTSHPVKPQTRVQSQPTSVKQAFHTLKPKTRGKKWLSLKLVFVGLVFVGLLIVGIIFLRSEMEKRELAENLRVCEKHFQANRLTNSRGGTALACYENILKKYPTNAKALAGLDKIEAHYVNGITQALKQKQIDKAVQDLARLRKVNPESPILVELEQKAKKVRQQAENEARYINAIKQALDQGQLNEAVQNLVSLRILNPELPQLAELESKIKEAREEKHDIFRVRLKEGRLGTEMVWIPAGQFRMGDIQGGGDDDEKPVHWISVNKFAISRYEVTVEEFWQFVNATGYKTEAEKGKGCYVYHEGSRGYKKDANWRNPYFYQQNNHPVVCVSWNDAIAYTKWLSKQTGKQYRLPTEAEWEYTALAGTETKYWWGNTASHEYANYGTDECCDGLATGKDRWKYTAPVGSFVANPFGLYDTVGNVSEWTCSEYENKYNGKEKRCIRKKTAKHVLRGGAWFNTPKGARSAFRNKGAHDNRSYDGGFRIVINQVYNEKINRGNAEAQQHESAKKLRECARHFKANRLIKGRKGNALACYQAVLKKYPNNVQAVTGLKNIEARYVKWIKRALDKRKRNKAKQYLASLRRVNPQSSQLAELEAQLSRLSMPPTREWKTIKAHKDGKKRAICWPDCLAFSPDGQFLLSGSFDNTLKLFNINTRKLVRTFEGHSDDVNSVAFSPDGQRVLSGSKDKTIKLWNLSTGQLIHTFKGHFDQVGSVAFSPDGQRALSCSDDNTIKLWNLFTGQLIHTFNGHSEDVESVAFSPDGQRILSGSDDKTIKLWNLSTNQLVHTFNRHSYWVYSVAFSPDGQRVLSGSKDKTIKLWNLSTGQLIHTFKGHSKDVNSVVFSPDGSFIASGSDDDTVKLWDVSSGNLICTLIGHKTDVWSVTFSPEGRLASGDRDGVIKLWR